VGQELLLEAIQQARRMGYRSMHGDTFPSMAAALTMYERLGFRRTGPYARCPTPGAIYLELLL
jgi:L-amino acid N-acyltransferase YncA